MTYPSSPTARQLRSFLLLSRPHFLVGGALMFGLGAAAASAVVAASYIIGQALVTMAQVTAHFLNEYADREVDRGVVNRTMFSGGSGMLVSGDLAPKTAWRAGLVTTALTVVLAALLVPSHPWTALLGMGALAVSWLYSMPPVRLLDTGWGEVATTLVVIGLVPLIGVTAQGSGPSPALWNSMAILFPIHLAVMLVFELPDLESDRAAGKQVVAVRIGRQNTERLIVGLLTLAVVGLSAGLGAGWLGKASTTAYLALLPGWVTVSAYKQHHYSRATIGGVITLGVSAVALIFGMI